MGVADDRPAGYAGERSPRAGRPVGLQVNSRARWPRSSCGIHTRAARRSRNHRIFRQEPQEMKTSYDPDADALYLRFADALIVESEEVAPGIILDFDAEKRIVAVEVLEARRHLAEGTEFPTAAE